MLCLFWICVDIEAAFKSSGGSGGGGGGYTYVDDVQTTNIYLGNINPKVCCHLFIMLDIDVKMQLFMWKCNYLFVISSTSLFMFIYCPAFMLYFK